MKKSIFLSLLIALICSAAFSTSFGELLDEAKRKYDAGDKKGAIVALDAARKLADSETIAASNDYIEITNWDVMKVRYDKYAGKKVKVKGMAIGFYSDNTYGVGTVIGSCTYDDNLIDTLLGLKEYSEHYFYGTVEKDKYGDPCIHIEHVE